MIPILKGGQGRTLRELAESAQSLTFFLVLTVGSLLLLAIGTTFYFAR